MKIKMTLLLLFITALSARSQTLADLKADVKKMFDASISMDFDNIFAYTYPKFFESFPKDQLKTAMEASFDNEYTKITLENTDPGFQFGPIKEVDGKKVVLIDYKTAMTMMFKQNFDTEEEQQYMLNSLKSGGLFKNVSINKEKKTIHSEMDSKMIGISDASTGNKWKFLNYDPSQVALETSIIGEKAMKALGL